MQFIKIAITQTGQEVCAHVSEADPPPGDSWQPTLEFMSQNPQVQLTYEQALELQEGIVAHSIQGIVMPMYCQLLNS